MSNQPGFFDRLNAWARRSVTLKLLTVGFIILLLLIPTSLLTSLIRERQLIRDQAIAEVSSKWGSDQTIAGPVISVPYRTARPDAEGKLVYSSGYAHFLPDSISVNGQVLPAERYRGIYVVVLYQARLRIAGHFGAFTTEGLPLEAEELQWDDALFTIGITDMKGVESAIRLQLGDSSRQVGPGTVTTDLFASGASVPVDLRNRPASLPFAFDLSLNGSSSLFFAPFGKRTQVELRSPWSHPSFEGTFLPDERTLSDTGFVARWEVLELNRNYPQQGIGSFIGSDILTPPYSSGDYAAMAGMPTAMDAGSFGLRLTLPIDEYQKTMRSAKYAGYFIVLTFLTFFFIEVLNHRRLHPIQYLLIGAAIVLFYVLLLSLSEHMAFNSAYLLSGLLIISLITAYSFFSLRNLRLTLLVAVVLTIFYGFFYSVLQLQDYALLLGSFGLLLTLALVMYLTRHIDWYRLNAAEEAD